MKARIVIGANFGDEGKGLVTDYLCASQGAGVVVRFNGGANAGHTVCTTDQERHVFRHFGSGTLCDVPTYLSEFFVCNPILFFEELMQIRELGFHPEVFAHPDCLVTTFMDMVINQAKETARGGKRHGSCGVGLHETIARSRVDELKITLGDLWNGCDRLEEQMREICGKYAAFRLGSEWVDDAGLIPKFIECCKEFAAYVNPLGMAQVKDPVFEGAQGLLLDQNNKKFFPHLTHSNTGMKNVEKLCAQAGITEKEIFYVSRTYLTRHGAGPLPGEDSDLSYEDETNHPTVYQGKLRFAPLDDGLLARCREDAGKNPFKLVLTHCDQKAPEMHSELTCAGTTRNDVGVAVAA
jgi:adenylosuccinate synthase